MPPTVNYNSDQNPPQRLHHLDALRGFAAMVVIFHHSRLIAVDTPPPVYLVPMFAGVNSVFLFFVLSGYVLSLPYWAAKQVSYGRYITRRVCRIYLPYAAAVIFAVLLGSHLLYAQLPLTHWFYATWHQPFTAREIFKNLVFLDISNVANINSALWSLRVEMVASIIFPAICWAFVRLPSTVCWGIAVIVDLLGVGWFPSLTNHLPVDWFPSLFYLSAFLFGAVLARNMDVVRAGYRRLNLVSKCVLLALVILAFYRGGGSIESLNLPACCGVIIFSDCSRAQKWLSTSIPTYLGKISYSLYLTHVPLLFAFTILLYRRTSFPIIILLVLSSCLGVSHLFWKYIEEPGIQLGRWLTKAKTTPQSVGSIGTRRNEGA